VEWAWPGKGRDGTWRGHVPSTKYPRPPQQGRPALTHTRTHPRTHTQAAAHTPKHAHHRPLAHKHSPSCSLTHSLVHSPCQSIAKPLHRWAVKWGPAQEAKGQRQEWPAKPKPSPSPAERCAPGWCCVVCRRVLNRESQPYARVFWTRGLSVACVGRLLVGPLPIDDEGGGQRAERR